MFRRGATAFRNARDLARSRRDRFIQASNSHHTTGQVQLNDEDWQDAPDSL